MATKPREAVITDAGDVLSLTTERLRDAGVEVTVLPPGTNPSEAAERLADAPVGIVGGMHLGVDEISRLRTTGLIIRAGIGYDVIDVDAATQAGIWVANVPDFCVEEVADHSILLLLAAMRRLPEAMTEWRVRRNWQVVPDLPTMHRVNGKQLGLIGFGRIGRLVAARAQSFGWQVTAHDPLVHGHVFSSAGVTQLGLDDLLATSDAVSLHCPLTTDNHHLIGRTNLARMKPGVIVVNTSRGGLVDLDALDDAVVAGRVSVAALDVLDGEPLPDLAHPLLGRSNVYVTAHTAWCSTDASIELASNTAVEALRFLDGERPVNLINPDARTEVAPVTA